MDKCGMPGDPDVEHTWDEGIQACATPEAQKQSALLRQVDQIFIELRNNSAQNRITVSPTVTTPHVRTSHSSHCDRIFKIVDLTIILITILCTGVCSFN